MTCLPVHRTGVDAAIILSDIMFPLEALGVEYELVSGRGPVIADPVRSRDAVDELTRRDPREVLSPIYRSIEGVRDELGTSRAVLGFAGAPFTLASYLVEGERQQRFRTAKSFLYERPGAWQALMDKLVGVTVDHLEAQIEAGADAVQLFDSWAGELSPSGYRRFALPHTRRIIEALDAPETPIIHFGTGTAGFLPILEEAGADVISVDWRISLPRARQALPRKRPLQGNLDPTLMTLPFDAFREELDELLAGARTLSGHVFNLGHGLLPETSPDTLRRVVEHVHEQTARDGGPSAAEDSPTEGS